MAFLPDSHTRLTVLEVAKRVSQVSHGSRLLICLTGCLLLVSVIYFTPLKSLLSDWESWVEYFREGGTSSGLCFMAVATLLITVGTPRLIFYTLAGLAFGFWQGLFWSVAACMAGSFFAFGITRWGLRDVVAHRFGHRMPCRALTDTSPSIMLVAVLRLLPISNLVINISLALSKIRLTTFLAGSMIGYLPQGVLAVLAGESLSGETVYTDYLQMLGFIALLWLVPLMARKYMLKNRQLALQALSSQDNN